ncbi:uncharacterized protein K489DRAFT_429940 [Dissoconium aciculare CBS 342.82]|uniref:Uncharacterized protein n=1 Tax=Dissoconium aciculare CBS 342.82 TaxID=1314786 RepID=A0A6J3MFS8_9PEZI|nr:uncharacterized protein K489DRAFT_429940 [Dissoconium aciculare CBS 342.82]KAF1825737.1 hypothetical protein K489DRAFT_429940 [Dissoconium aciculare CBS 342.82]
MSSEQTPLEIAAQPERDLNSREAKVGASKPSDSANESGIDANVINKFPGSTVTYGSAASGAGDNPEIPEEEGGSLNPRTGQPTKARDFEGEGGLEEKAAKYVQDQPGNDDVRENIRN